MVEVKDLATITMLFVLTALLIGVGILTMDKFGDATKTNTGVTDEAIALTYAGSNQYTGTLAYNDVRSISAFKNSTNNATAVSDVTFTKATGAVVLSNATNPYAAGTFYATYVYGAESQTSLALANQSSSIGDISTDWMSLMITIVVLSIILGLVIKSFVMGKR